MKTCQLGVMLAKFIKWLCVIKIILEKNKFRSYINLIY